MPGTAPGKVVAVEGVEGAGKSTLLRALCERLEERPVSVLSLREPGGTVLGERIRDMLLHGDKDLSPETELFLFMASRSHLVRERILPAIAEGTTVLVDRYLLSSVAYQGGAGGVGIEEAINVGRLAVRGAEPDLSILLDLEPEEGLARISGGELDRIESRSLDYHRRVRRGYLDAAAVFPWPVVVIPAAGPPDEVLEEAWKAVDALF